MSTALFTEPRQPTQRYKHLDKTISNRKPIQLKHHVLKVTEEPPKDTVPTRKHLTYNEASKGVIKTRLADSLGRTPWHNNVGATASYSDEETEGMNQERLQAIMNQLTNDIRVNGRRISPLHAQIVHQAPNGQLTPSSPASDMQNDMPEDYNNMKPTQLPWDSNGGNNFNSNNGNHKNGGQMMGGDPIERLMFGGMSQVFNGKGKNSDSEGGMSNIPGLSFGDENNNGAINLMEGENGLQPMNDMGGMHGTNGMNRMNRINDMNRINEMTGMTGIYGMNGMNGMNGIMKGMRGMNGMTGIRPFRREGSHFAGGKDRASKRVRQQLGSNKVTKLAPVPSLNVKKSNKEKTEEGEASKKVLRKSSHMNGSSHASRESSEKPSVRSP